MRVSHRTFGVLAAIVLTASACGAAEPAAKPSPSPPASGVAALDRLDKSTMQDGHNTIDIHLADGVDLTGDGWISFKPHMAEYSLLTGTSNGSETFLETLAIGSVNYMKAGFLGQRSTAKWERGIFDRLVTSPSEYLIGVTKTSGKVRPVVTTDTIGGTATWLVKADTPDGLQELWLRQSDYYLMRYRLTASNGYVAEFTVDRFNIKPALVVPPDSEVVDSTKVTCGFATEADFVPERGQRTCGLEGLGASYEAVDFASSATLPSSLTPYVVDYAGNETRDNEGVKIDAGAAVLTSESSAHEVDLVYTRHLADVVVVADFEQTGNGDASVAGISVRCSQTEDLTKGCLAVGVRPDGHFQVMEKATSANDYVSVLHGQAKVTAGTNRLVVWAHGDQVGIGLNGILLGTYKTTLLDEAYPFFFHQSLSETDQSQVRLFSLAIYEPRLLTLAELMRP